MSLHVPPHSLDHEAELLGCVMLEHEVYGRTKTIVQPADFYSPANALLWETFGVIADRGTAIDQISVRSELVRAGNLERVGGDAYVVPLGLTVPTTSRAESYAKRVRELAQIRACIAACAELAALGYGAETFEAYRTEIEKRTRELTTSEAAGEPDHIGTIVGAAINDIEDRSRRKGAIKGHTTGIVALDHALGGWERQRLYIIAGRPGMGKSALTSATIERTTLPSLFFSIEMPANEVGTRLLASDTGLDMADLKAAKLGRDAWADIARASARLSDRPIYVDTKTKTLDQITAVSRRFKAKHGEIGWIIVDYLQLMQGERGVPREQQVSSFSRELKALTKELNVPVIALSQLNRQCEERPDKRPQINDLRESGAIEQDADAIVFVYRRGYYAMQAKSTNATKRGRWDAESDIAPGDDDGIAELLIPKNRGGPPTTVRCLFQGQHARFVDLEPEPTEHHQHWTGDADE